MADVSFLRMPLDCTLGKTCVISDYPDVDPTTDVADYRCGQKSREAHSGTDFSLLTFEQMKTGVAVLAAADGRVQAIRNTRPDQPYVPGTDLNGQECGNAVRIDHGNGYQSVYCHLKLGSVPVTPGQRVLAGQRLGEVGLSGQTIFPHLHLTITQGSDIIDPFAPDQINACGEPLDSLWRETPRYIDGGLASAGVSLRMPDMEDVQSGAARVDSLSPTDPMILYGHAFHGIRGDLIELVMHGPNEEIFSHTARLDADQPRFFRAFGRRPPATGWDTGTYRGYVTMKRGDTILAVRRADVAVQ
ncbi:M23 family metallopeptidase [Marivita sp. S2033]|uniref:M23 family metallopeptidase n=1 Tax=Marivita sp. S2033 TaxID=3373187 RepID=UPI0039827869